MKQVECYYSQGWDGNGEVMRGSLGGVDIFMHSGHCWMKLLISLEMFNHHTKIWLEGGNVVCPGGLGEVFVKFVLAASVGW